MFASSFFSYIPYRKKSVLDALRAGRSLSAKETEDYERGLVGILRQLHDEIDAAVFDAYGWPHSLSNDEILEKLVALNAERAAEERGGLVRWLRPEFQNPKGQVHTSQVELETEDETPESAAPSSLPWPKKLPEQFKAVRELLAPGGIWSLSEITRSFTKAKQDAVSQVLESLQALGILLTQGEGLEQRWRSALQR